MDRLPLAMLEQPLKTYSGNRQTRQQGRLYMVFEYMDHDLTGLLDNPQVAFRPEQVKCYMKQLLEGTSYLHKVR